METSNLNVVNLIDIIENMTESNIEGNDIITTHAPFASINASFEPSAVDQLDNILLPNIVVTSAEVVPNTAVPNTAVPNMVVPNTAVPNTAVPNMVVPNIYTTQGVPLGTDVPSIYTTQGVQLGTNNEIQEKKSPKNYTLLIVICIISGISILSLIAIIVFFSIKLNRSRY